MLENLVLLSFMRYLLAPSIHLVPISFLSTEHRAKGERKNLILPSFITRKETKPSSLASSRPSFGEKFKFGFYYLSFFEYGETSTVLASKKLFGRSLLS